MATILAANISSVEGSLESPPSWQAALRKAIRCGRQLCERLGLPPSLVGDVGEAQFPVFAPLEFVQRMQPGDPCDPLLLQVLGGVAENAGLQVLTADRAGVGAQIDPTAVTVLDRVAVGEAGQAGQALKSSDLPKSGDGVSVAGVLDPVGDWDARRTPGLLQKYHGRVLLMTAGACAIHCRYCFRRHFPYDTVPKGRTGWQAAIDEISHDETIEEVILSGGDPLMVSDDQLAWLVQQLVEIPHVQRLRVHSRLPVVIPQRVTPALVETLARNRLATYMVLHINHGRELDEGVDAAIAQLRSAGITVLNQAVLLRGVNERLEDQVALCNALVNRQVIPYYLHQLDPVIGALHFAVDDATAVELVQGMRSLLPGYAVPELVREIAGRASKTPVRL